MNAKILISMAVAASLTAPAAFAGRYSDYDDNRRGAYAKVLKVTPIYKTIEVASPERNCWNESTTSYVEHHRNSGANAFVGGLIGGIIGHQFGRGKGKHAATAMGTLIGASIGAENSKIARTPRVSSVQKCRTSHSYYTEEQRVGYRVKYKYQGRIYHSRMDRHPGNRMRVRVNIEPAE